MKRESSRTMAAEQQNQNRELSAVAGRPTSTGLEADEQQLLLAFQRGNLDAFSVLVHRYQDRLFNALTRFLDSREDAQDVLQDAFLSAFAHAKSFQGNSRFYTWVYRIAMNHAIDLHRRKKPRQTLSLHREDASDWDMHSKEEAAHAAIEQQENCQMVRRALKVLSDEHRLVIVMKELDDMRYEEIAEVLEVPVGTVRSRLHRARLELKTVLEKMEQG
ncbi:MAG TPA: sigma-70 family RNA polymerase sigma factor [Gemmatales bacterium]|nr:sigma-70 family RNA polymerase sigma factor [Gemmatales bacterium]